jgi:hypothetical protein
MKGEKNNTEFCGDTERERGRERERDDLEDLGVDVTIISS